MSTTFCDDALDDEAIADEDASLDDETSLVVTPPDDEAWLLDVTAVDVLD